MKKKILAVFLSLCMAMSLLPVTALAAETGENTPSTQAATTLPEDENGVITLKGDVELAATYTVAAGKNIKLDLHGHTISPATQFTEGHLITVSEGGRLTLTDSVGGGKLESTASSVRGILNHGTFNMDSGAINVYNYAVTNEVTQTSYNNNQPIVCNITGGELSASYAWTIFLKGAGIAGQQDGNKQGINFNGPHSIRNDLIQTSISGNAKVTGIQAITTNASNGIYAGFTLDISGNARIVDESAGDSAIYLPAVGVTTISENAYISGAQGIRFCAGELTITGGTIVGTDVSDEEDLIAGGSGGTKGAIVIGKAGGGYVGDVTVNISGTAEVVNTAKGTADDTRPAIVVSDKNMGDESKGYDKLSISVNVDGATITGDVVKVSNLSGDNTKDGGNTSLMIQNTTVEGDVTNQSKTGVTILDSTVNGTVRASSGHTLVLGDSTVGMTNSSGDGSLYVENSESPDNSVVAVNNRTATTYDDLAKALTDAQDGDTITLMKDIENLDDGSITQPRGVYTITKAITLNGNGHSISVSADFGNANIINVENSGTVAIKDLTVNGNDSSRHCINIFSATDTKTPSEVTLENVVTTGGKTGVTIGGSTVTIKGADTNIATGEWSAVNVDSTSSSTRDASLTVVEGTIGAILLENTAGTKNVSTAVQGGNIASITTANNNTSATVTGGTFNESVAEYVDASRLKYESNLNGTYTYYGTLEDALATGGIVQSVETAQVADAYKHILTLMNNGDVTAQIVLASNEPYELPTLPNQGYNRFQGWRSSVNGEVYPGGQEVTISADTTFTAVWSYTPPANPNYKITIGDMENGTVTADPAAAKAGAEVTLTATPDEGYAVGTITVTDRFGDAVRVTEQADGTYTFTMPNGQVTVKATFVETEEPAPAEPFPDVDENDWFYDEVVYVYENGLMNGVENNQFAPNTATNRAMLATILYRLAGEPAVSGDLPFTDVESGTWYTDAVLWAAQNGIVNGLGENTFAPMNTLTREQLVTMLYRYAEAAGYDVSAAADLSGYPDAGKVQTYAQKAMSWAVAEGIVEGMDGNLNPAGNATRAQIATILMRFCEGVAK